MGNCGGTSNTSENSCITLIHYSNKVAFYYNKDTETLEVRYFTHSKNTSYYGKPVSYNLDNFSILAFDTILANLINSPNVNFEIKELKVLANKIILYISEHYEQLPDWQNILPFFIKILDPSSNNINFFNRRRELTTINKGNKEKDIQTIRKYINNGKDYTYIFGIYKNNYTSEDLDSIIGHRIVDDLYKKRDNMNHYRQVLKRYSNRKFKSAINYAERIIRFGRSY